MWTQDPQRRLAEWREFRQQLNDFDTDQALEKISFFWSYAPFVEKHLDPAKPKSWPDPWTLLWNDRYCDLSRALGMLYTWELTNHSHQYQSQLKIYRDHKNQTNVNCFCIDDNQYILNAEYNTVLKKHCFNRSFELIHTYPANILIEK